MTSKEFKQRLAAGDNLAVVMMALVKYRHGGPELTPDGFTHLPEWLRNQYESKAAHILTALASAGVKK